MGERGVTGTPTGSTNGHILPCCWLTWVLSSQAHSVGRNPSLHHRYPLAGIEGRAGGSLGHGSQACSVPCTGSRSSRAGTPGRSHPQVSRAGCACSSRSCMDTGAVRLHPPVPKHSSPPTVAFSSALVYVKIPDSI